MRLPQKQHTQQHLAQNVAELARRRGRKIGIAVNARPAARARKGKVVNDTKFGFEDDGQRRHAEPHNINGGKQIKHQGTPVHDVGTHFFVNS